MMQVIIIILSFIVYIIIDYLMIKYEIKSNIFLFYDLHKDIVIKVLNENDKLLRRELGSLYYDDIDSILDSQKK